MNISILLMEQIIQLFLMIFMGYLIVKVRLVKDEDSKVLSKIILYLIIPCVIINAFQVDYTMDTVKGLLLALAASVMTQVLLLIIISISGKLLHLNEVEIASVYYSNSGNLIVPIVTFILGQDWVLYGCVFMSVQLIFLWTHCKKIISRESSYDWKKIVLNINMISIFIGVVLLAAAICCEHLITGLSINIPAIALFVASYIVLGGEIVLKAGRNILKGQIFDENFLMSVATIGAFAIAEYPEAVGVMLFFRIGELFEKIAVERSRSQIMDAVDLRPEQVSLVENGEVTVIPAEQAQVGDVVLVRPGDRIPLDGTVIEGSSRIDTSAVTGESVPVKVEAGSQVMSGCVNESTVIKIRVDKVLGESMVTRILDSVENAAAGKPRIDNFITRFARVYTPIVVAVALFTAIVIPLVTGQEFFPWVYTALSFLVMSCPCALVLSVPLAFFSGIGAGSKRGILFKGGLSMEALAGVKAVVMDKTGTVTKGNFEVQNLVPNGCDENKLLQLCASCEQASTHPIAKSIVDYANSSNVEILSADTIEEISGKGIKAVINGKTVLCGNKKLMNDFNIDMSGYSQTDGTQVLVTVDGKYSGYVVIADTIKPDAKSAVSGIKQQHIFTAMLTGDDEKTANAVAKQTGIDQVHAKLLPEDKLTVLKEIRSEHGSVMFVGDGINDAPVLAGADVGAAMGSGADAAIEAADVVIMNSDVESVPKAISISKRTTVISRENVVFALVIKIIVMLLGITGIYANMWLAVFADTGVAMLCILNSIRILYMKSFSRE